MTVCMCLLHAILSRCTHCFLLLVTVCVFGQFLMREDVIAVITGNYTSNLFTTRSAYHPAYLWMTLVLHKKKINGKKIFYQYTCQTTKISWGGMPPDGMPPDGMLRAL